MLERVLICGKDKALRIFPELLSKAGFKPKKYDQVLVKPNLCGMYHPEPRLIECVLRYFEPRAKRIIIGETDSIGNTPEGQFRRLGVLEMLKGFKRNIEIFVDLKRKEKNE